MRFTESEVRFLCQPHPVETAMGARTLRPSVDLRMLGCPADVFEKILECRARQLGSKFTEFRNKSLVEAPSGLDARIAGSGLF